MKVLWITNIPFPPICIQQGWSIPAIGGWMYSSAKRLAAKEDIQLFVAFPRTRSSVFVDETIDGVRYFSIPYGYRSTTKSYSFVREYWRRINNLIKPDIVHIHGTEYAHGNDYIRSCGAENVIVSIQGLISECSSFYYGGVPEGVFRKYFTLSDVLRRSTIIGEKKGFDKRGLLEINTLKQARFVIGRTTWDRAHALAINPNLIYYHCNETLRDAFYTGEWGYSKCEPYSIFISQAAYPLKGLHVLLAALPLVLLHYPKTKLYVAGQDITRKKPWYRYSGYGKFIKKLIERLDLSNYIEFTGPLDEEQMKSMYLRSNLYICPSSLENSSNSLGEAQLLGVPTIASYVGGAPDMMTGNEEYLYRFEDKVMLANKICLVFSLLGNIETSSIRSEARKRHDPNTNLSDLLSVYNIVFKKIQG